MVTLYRKNVEHKRFTKVKNFRNYEKAWNYVADELVKIDYRLHLGYSLQHLCDGYTKRRVFPFASHEVTRKGVVFRIKI
jgi:hypothetical protein